nr:copia protein [Tanacetum cinerariifolium]
MQLWSKNTASVTKLVKALYGLHQAPRAWYETLANYLLENGFQRGKIDQTLFIKKQKGDILLVQKQDGIFISQDKYVAKILRKFGFIDGKSATTPIDIEKPLLKDPDGEDVDIHTYSDYAGASLDRKSTTGGCQLLGCTLIYWQCKKQTVVATSSTEAEYVAATSCCAQVLWIQNQLLDYGLIITVVSSKFLLFGLTIDVVHLKLLGHKTNDVVRLQALIDSRKVIITEDTVCQVLRLDDAESIDCLPNEEIFAKLARMGYEEPSTKLTFYKAFFSTQWKFLIHTILQWRIIAEIDADEDVTLKEVDAEIKAKDADAQGRLEESQAQVYHIDLEHADKILRMHDDEAELTKLTEVLKVVTTEKLMTEVVIAAAITTAAPMPTTNATRRRKGVVIRNPEEMATPSIIVHSESKSKDKGKGILVKGPKLLKKQAQIEQDEAYARGLEAELNANII